MKNIPSILKFSIGVVVIFIFTFLLEIRHVWVIVDSLIEIVNLLVWNCSLWIFKKLMIKVETELSLAIV